MNKLINVTNVNLSYNLIQDKLMITCQLFFFTCTMMKLKLKKNKLFNYSAGWIQNLTLEFGRERGCYGKKCLFTI